ncbi:DNA-binding IclR family transcriptional regulator [Lipingzhangella halophila]|uniref:DNA-binding IclR family transcriptional regulator n=1 Tax=Lipingzhangella halophila TaxID=1783352 RepID=A0A7W7W314_9ACTN|nr:IclR family transcriptional regulator [Lipingzhangella halophila]MBB4931334.1 DNA-binding IclR family transcriptional regulator [Lipingzhangella halophila]
MNSAQLALKAVRLLAHRGELSVTELAAELQIARSTAHRVLANCVATGYARQDHVGGPYVMGHVIHELALGATSAVTLRDAAAPVLVELRDSLNLTSSLSILENRSTRFVQSLEGRSPHRLNSRLGLSCPAHCTSGGKAILAYCSEEDLERRYPTRTLRAMTEHSIDDWDELRRRLDLVRLRGWDTNIGESNPGVNAVGAPILVGSGEPIAAVSVASVAPRLCTRAAILDVADELVDAATRIQSAMRGAPVRSQDPHELGATP